MMEGTASLWSGEDQWVAIGSLRDDTKNRGCEGDLNSGRMTVQLNVISNDYVRTYEWTRVI